MRRRNHDKIRDAVVRNNTDSSSSSSCSLSSSSGDVKITSVSEAIVDQSPNSIMAQTNK